MNGQAAERACEISEIVLKEVHSRSLSVDSGVDDNTMSDSGTVGDGHARMPEIAISTYAEPECGIDQNISTLPNGLTSESKNKRDFSTTKLNGVLEYTESNSDVYNKGQLRAELKGLLKEHEKDMVTLTDNVMSVDVQGKGGAVDPFDERNLKNETLSHHQLNPDVHEGPFSIGVSEDGGMVAVLDQSANTYGVDEIRVSEDNVGKTDQTIIEEIVIKPSEDENRIGAESQPHVNITRKSLRERKPTKNLPANEQSVADKKAEVTSEQFIQNLNLKMDLLEGHHDAVCAVDFYNNFVISGGRDTSLKLWSASSRDELKSFGGHNATITGVCFMKDQDFSVYPNVVTSSYDCSLRIWNLEEGVVVKSIYVYSPVVCLDYSNGIAAVGTEGGKIELYDVITGKQLFSVHAHEDSVSTIKLLTDGKVVSGSSDGLIKIYDPDCSSPPIFSLDSAKLKIKHFPSEEPSSDVATRPICMNLSKVNCMCVWKDFIIYGDDGHNVKILDYKKGELLKLCNNLKEYSPTEALSVCQINAQSYLFCVGSDVDSGDSYINVRTLPDFCYHGTIRDSTVNSGAITSLSVQEIESRVRFVTGGTQLRVWDQVTRRGKKRKSSSECDSLISCKYICQYNEIKESEAESDDNDESSFSETSSKENSLATSKQSYCVIL